MPISAGDLATVATLSIADYLRNSPVDQIGYNHPFFMELMKKRKQLNPGLNQKVQVRKGYGTNFAWSKGESARTFNKRDTVDQASYEWYTGVDGLYLPWDQLFAAGVKVEPDSAAMGKLSPTSNEKAVITNMISEQMEALEKGFKEKLDLELHRDGTSGTDAVVGLDALVSRTPTVGAVGGLDPATKAYWRNYFLGSVAQASLIATMEIMWRACHRNGSPPNFIMVGSTALDIYRGTLTLTQNVDAGRVKRIDVGTGEGVRTGLFFKGVELIWNPAFSELDTIEAPASTDLWEKRMYFINTNELLYEDDGMTVYSPASPNNIRATYVAVDCRVRLKSHRRNSAGLIIVSGS